MTTPTVTTAGLGWQLHLTDYRSDKYYRVLIVRTPKDRALYVLGYGRRGNYPNLKFTRQFPTVQAATDFATAKAQEKLAKGYGIVVDPTPFTVPEADLQNADETFQVGSRVDDALAQKIYAAFTQTVGRTDADL